MYLVIKTFHVENKIMVFPLHGDINFESGRVGEYSGTIGWSEVKIMENSDKRRQITGKEDVTRKITREN